MKKIIFYCFIPAFFSLSCNNAGKDSVEKADSANEAKLDTALNRNTTVIDEASSEFIVRVANSGLTEEQMATIAHQKAIYPDVQSFAAMLHHDHAAVNNTVKEIAAAKKITLPTTITEEKQAEINDLKSKTGKELDKSFVKTMIKNHTLSIEMFENAMLDTKDPEIRSFADKTLPALRAHLDSAKTLDKKYW